jgi:hypothetical protein
MGALFMPSNYGYCIQKSISHFLCQLKGCACAPGEAGAHKQLLSVSQVLVMELPPSDVEEHFDQQ